MFENSCWVNPLTACTLIQNYILMNDDEVHKIQETALLADTKICYNLIWLCVNVCIQLQPQENILRIAEEEIHEAGKTIPKEKSL
jgi:hypothetical protein